MKPQPGVTLVEVLIALAVLAIALFALTSTQILGLRVTYEAGQQSIATQVAVLALERVNRALVAAEFSCGGAGSLPCTGSISDVEIAGAMFEARFAITLPAGPENTERGWMALVRVEVSEPATVWLARYVSCLEAVPPPSFHEPAPCVGKGG